MSKPRKLGIKSTYIPNAKADMRRHKNTGLVVLGLVAYNRWQIDFAVFIGGLTMPCRHYKFYSVYDRDTEMPVIIHATAKEIQELLSITAQSFYTYVSHTRNGTRKNKYEIYLDDPEEDE